MFFISALQCSLYAKFLNLQLWSWILELRFVLHHNLFLPYLYELQFLLKCIPLIDLSCPKYVKLAEDFKHCYMYRTATPLFRYETVDKLCLRFGLDELFVGTEKNKELVNLKCLIMMKSVFSIIVSTKHLDCIVQ